MAAALAREEGDADVPAAGADGSEAAAVVAAPDEAEAEVEAEAEDGAAEAAAPVAAAEVAAPSAVMAVEGTETEGALAAGALSARPLAFVPAGWADEVAVEEEAALGETATAAPARGGRRRRKGRKEKREVSPGEREARERAEALEVQARAEAEWAVFEQRAEEARRAAAWQAEALQEVTARGEVDEVDAAAGAAVRAASRIQRSFRLFTAEAEVLGDASAVLYAVGGVGATVAEVRGAVQSAFRRGRYGDGVAAATARADRAFSRAVSMWHGARGLEEEDRVEPLWATFGRPPDEAAWRVHEAG